MSLSNQYTQVCFYYSLNIPLRLALRNTVFYFSKCFKTGVCFTVVIGVIFLHVTCIQIFVAHWISSVQKSTSNFFSSFFFGWMKACQTECTMHSMQVFFTTGKSALHCIQSCTEINNVSCVQKDDDTMDFSSAL